MPKSSDSKRTKSGYDRSVRKRDHPKIQAIVEKLVKDSSDPDILHAAKAGQLVLNVAKELAPEHKWYRPMLDMPVPAMDKLYRSLLDHIYTTYIAGGLSNPTEHESSD